MSDGVNTTDVRPITSLNEHAVTPSPQTIGIDGSIADTLADPLAFTLISPALSELLTIARKVHLLVEELKLA